MTPETPVCPQCGEPTVRSLNFREALLHPAKQPECPVEMMDQSDALMSLSGIGCLLRYRPGLQHMEPVSPGQV